MKVFKPLLEAQRLHKSERTALGFYLAYEQEAKMGSNWKNVWPWLRRRRLFLIDNLWSGMNKRAELYDKDGVPTPRHLRMIAWGYSPDSKNLKLNYWKALAHY